MKKLATASTVLAFGLALPQAAEAHFIGHAKGKSLQATVKYQKKQLDHAKYVCARGTGRVKHWHCLATQRAARELRESERKLAALSRPRVDSCLHELLMREGGYNPHKWNGGYVGPWDPHSTHGGSGAYGGPQALPGSKMASAGADWRDNIWTQIRWMIGYVNGRYGGSCAALAFQKAHGFY